ncbi:MAG: hypothetical protein ACI4S3_05475 [Candidatus Gastranaerophilaceae bacterium]
MNRTSLVNCGKNACEYLAKKGKSACRQAAYYTIPADIRAGYKTGKIKKHSFSLAELNKRADQYEGYLLRNGKIVKAVNNIKESISGVNNSFNRLSIVKLSKKMTKNVSNFLKEYFG